MNFTFFKLTLGTVEELLHVFQEQPFRQKLSGKNNEKKAGAELCHAQNRVHLKNFKSLGQDIAEV